MFHVDLRKKLVYCSDVGLKILYMSVRSIQSKALYKSVVPLMILFLDDPPIVENGVFQSPAIIVVCLFHRSHPLILAFLIYLCVSMLCTYSPLYY